MCNLCYMVDFACPVTFLFDCRTLFAQSYQGNITCLCSYHTMQNFDRGNIDEFYEFPAIHQYFPYQNF